MNEYISKQALLDKTVKRNHAWLYTTNSEGKNLKEIVDELPPADVRPNIHGHWIEKEGSIYVCSECEGAELFEAKFCHTCGAIMDGKEEKGEI